jgi:hypothetical protein
MDTPPKERWLLWLAVAAAFIPSAGTAAFVFGNIDLQSPLPALFFVFFMPFVWLALALSYCIRTGRKSARWIFLLAPVVLAPLVFGLLVRAGVIHMQ